MFFFPKNFVKNLFDARGLCVRALTLRAVTIAMNCVPRDSLARRHAGASLL